MHPVLQTSLTKKKKLMKKKGTQAQEAEIDFDITNERTIHSNDGKPSSGS